MISHVIETDHIDLSLNNTLEYRPICVAISEDPNLFPCFCLPQDGVPHAPFLLCPSPPSPRHCSCQSDEHQVTQELWATILLVHHCEWSSNLYHFTMGGPSCLCHVYNIQISVCEIICLCSIVGRQSAPAVKDPEPGQIRTHLVQQETTALVNNSYMLDCIPSLYLTSTNLKDWPAKIFVLFLVKKHSKITRNSAKNKRCDRVSM